MPIKVEPFQHAKYGEDENLRKSRSTNENLEAKNVSFLKYFLFKHDFKLE